MHRREFLAGSVGGLVAGGVAVGAAWSARAVDGGQQSVAAGGAIAAADGGGAAGGRSGIGAADGGGAASGRSGIGAADGGGAASDRSGIGAADGGGAAGGRSGIGTADGRGAAGGGAGIGAADGRGAVGGGAGSTGSARDAAASAKAGGATVTDQQAAQRYTKERRFAQTKFGRIAYIDRGVGPAVLFLHGFPLSSFQWRGAIDRLSTDRRCLAPDSMGLGYTEVASGQSVTPSAQAGMLAEFLDKLSVKEVDLIANDSGGAVAQLFVTRYPQMVRSLLLTNCDVETDSPPAALKQVLDMARVGAYPELWLEPWLNHKELARSAYGLGGLCYSNTANLTDVAIEQYLAPLVASVERKALVNRYALGLSPNPLAGIAPLLKKSPVPTRVVWGMSDTIFSSRSPDYLSALLPKFAGIRRIPEAKLFFPEEYPDIIATEARLLWGRA